MFSVINITNEFQKLHYRGEGVWQHPQTNSYPQLKVNDLVWLKIGVWDELYQTVSLQAASADCSIHSNTR